MVTVIDGDESDRFIELSDDDDQFDVGVRADSACC